MTPTAGEPRRKRPPRKRGNKRPRKRGGSGGGQWQLQQTKVTFRNVEGSEKYGTALQITTMISQMVEKVNEETKHLPIRLDKKSIDRIVKAEELAIAAKEAEQGEDKEESTRENDQRMEDVEEPKTPDVTMAEIVRGNENDASGPFIAARVLYVVPAKRSRRRGEKSGNAYVVLSAPPPPPPEPKPVDSVGPPVKDESQVKEEPLENKNTSGEGNDDKMDVDSENPTKVHGEPKETTEGIKAPTPHYTPAEKSRFTAIAKLQLQNAVEDLAAHAKQDARTNQLYGKCEVAASMSGKAWRDKEGGHRDRREGTIESTGDFKQFFAKQSKAEEERQNRPKPAPGGGGGGSATENGENGQPLSAIVMHLRAKKQEQAQRKKAKKKANKEAKKGKQQVGAGGSNRDGKGRNNSKAGGGRGKGRREGSRKKSENAAQPAMVLTRSSQNGSG